MEPIAILSWGFFSLIVGFIGIGRSVGFFGAFFISLILSPVIGLIITVLSKSDSQKVYETNLLANQVRQTQELQSIRSRQESSFNQSKRIEELERLARLKEAGHLTHQEFEQAKENLLSPPTVTNQTITPFGQKTEKEILEEKDDVRHNNLIILMVVFIIVAIFLIYYFIVPYI